jgi:hypothetical protein
VNPVTVTAGLVLLAAGIFMVWAWLPDGADIRLAYARPGEERIEISVDTCYADLTADVAETSQTVTITVTSRNTTTRACLDGMFVELGAPWGGRTVIDGSDGEEVSVLPGD